MQDDNITMEWQQICRVKKFYTIDTSGQCYKFFYIGKLQISVIS